MHLKTNAKNQGGRNNLARTFRKPVAEFPQGNDPTEMKPFALRMAVRARAFSTRRLAGAFDYQEGTHP